MDRIILVVLWHRFKVYRFRSVSSDSYPLLNSILFTKKGQQPLERANLLAFLGSARTSIENDSFLLCQHARRYVLRSNPAVPATSSLAVFPFDNCHSRTVPKQRKEQEYRSLQRRNDHSPGFLIVFDNPSEIIIEQKVLQPRMAIVSIFDILQESRPDDASTSEYHRDSGHSSNSNHTLQKQPSFGQSLGHTKRSYLHRALCEPIDKCSFRITAYLGFAGPFNTWLAAIRSSFMVEINRANTDSVMTRAERPVQCALACPFSGSFLSGGIQDDVDHRLPGFRICFVVNMSAVISIR